MKFQLTDEQTNKFIEWRRVQAEKGRYRDGPRFTFSFTPTNNKILVSVKDHATKEELELTTFED